MRTLMVVLVTFATAGLVCGEEPEPRLADALPVPDQCERSQSDQDLLQGAWQVQVWRIRGSRVNAAPHRKTFDGDTMISIETRGTRVTKGATPFKLDPSKTPKEIDFPESKTPAGKSLKGIYLLEGDVLVICIGREGNRPSRFQARERDENELQILLRVR